MNLRLVKNSRYMYNLKEYLKLNGDTMKKLVGYFLSLIIFISCITDYAYGVTTLDKKAEAPEIFADAAVLIEASSGTVLYNKKMNEKMYPASITKILTTLLALENSSLNETVTFSHYDVYTLEPGAAHIGMKENEQISMKDTLYGVMLDSANECANAAAEHVGKKTDAYKKKISELNKSGVEYDESEVAIQCFTEMMNKKAKDAGAKSSNFVNPHGLFNENHYTTCYDMAMITREAIKNSNFLKIEANTRYTIGKTNLTDEERYCKNRHAMMREDEAVYYEGIIAGKTGYVDQSGNTLVTVAKRDDITLISVVMKSNTYNVYNDTKLLLDYGFSNYECVNISQNETKFSLSNDGFFSSIGSIFSEQTALLRINPNGYVIVPKGTLFTELTSEIVFNKEKTNEDKSVATIKYYLRKQQVGETTLDVVESKNESGFEFGPSKVTEEKTEKEKNKKVKIDVRIIFGVLIVAFLLFIVYKYMKYLKKSGRSRSYIRRQRYGRSTRRTHKRESRTRYKRNVHRRHRHHY